MPAVQLIQLNQQINALTQHFADPIAFRNEVEMLLVRYADLTYKPGQAVRQSNLAASSYRTSPIVLRKLAQRMAGLAAHNPELALATADHLWQAEQAEMRQLAAVLIGNLPAEFSGEVLKRLQAWTVPGIDVSQMGRLFEQCSIQLRHSEPNQLLEIVRSWLDAPDIGMVRLGVIAITTLVSDHDFENLPAVYNAISPLLVIPHDELKHELRALLVQLARRSPTETGYFLRQVMGSNPSPELTRLVRRVLPEFPEEIQNRIRGLLFAFQRE
ncbi:MAG: DNA alkylation repair protein [Bellilinea sp.]